MKKPINRRDFLKRGGALLAAGALPMSLVEIAYGKDSKEQGFTFAYISDSHITHVRGKEFVRNWDRGLIQAVAEANLLTPRPDFIMYGGDIAQLGKREEIDHGLEILSGLRGKARYVMGEHDYYLDLGKYWRSKLGRDHYSFDHKGVHFIVLNSILTYDEWTYHRWPSAAERMHQMARLDNPHGSPFMVGDAQREWLRKELEKVSVDTPLVVFSHSPLQKIYKGWNFWTDDAEQVQALLKPFKKVTVLYGHVHQIQYNQIGNISFHSAMATAWPWPYPQSFSQAPSHLPKLTVPMDRADPFFERDGTGWQFINLHTGHVDAHYLLPDNQNRVVAYDAALGHPVDTVFQAEDRRIPPQTHY
ncbi:MAG: serine/threonine protein phosphatase [Chromatiales bacterium 21-64-14]|nr:MAG: serine/threonine protein phosphatase [Chromatiales bacterium 21-64-14]HQU16169.1 metallophosphoesterase [Gammaproteobacteria bacterium]